MGDKLGMECMLYIDTTPLADGPLSANWSEVKTVREVTTNMEAGEADMTSRANSGWRSTRATLRDASIDIELIWDPTDTEVEALRDAYLSGDEIAMAVMDGDITVSGSEGFVANVTITGFSRAEPLEEGLTVSVTAKPKNRHQWYEVAP